MQDPIQHIQLAFRHNLPERKQIIAWIVSVAVWVIVAVLSQRIPTKNPDFFGYLTGLYVLDSAIFFVLLGERPKMRLVMLTFIFLLEVAAIGYYILSSAVV